jgi:hypothetical protein
MIRATTWVNLEDILLSERSLSQQSKYCIISVFEVPRVVRHTDKSRVVSARGRRNGS